jgi:hypothetical protein
MAAPNLVNTTSIIGKTTAYAVTASLATTGVENPANSNKLLRISTIIAANKSAGTVGISVSHFRASTHRYMASTIPVPANASIVLLSKVDGGGLNLEEGDAIHALAGSASAIDLLISYEEIA